MSDAAPRVELRPPHEVRRIARRLEEAGHATWAVGGAVRDVLAGREAGDWDLTTAARPGEVRRLFRRTVPIGIEHGTVGVVGADGRMYEVTTFRRDVETFGRKARVVFAERLEEDLERRDFTINAVAWHPLTGEVRDPHGGVEDLRAGILRTVGEPAERFAEDRLRVLRALRFAGRFGLTIEAATWSAVRASAGLLGQLSAERVREELVKVLGGPAPPSASLQLYADSGVLAHLYPELQACVGLANGREEGDVWRHLLRVTDAVPRHRTTLRLAALLHDVGKPVTTRQGPDGVVFPGHARAGQDLVRVLLRRLKASNETTDRVAHLVAQHASLPAAAATDAEVRRWIRLIGRAYLADLFRLAIADTRARPATASPPDLVALVRRVRRLLRETPALSVADLAIDGADMRALGLPPGPLYGEILRALLERVTDEPALNRREVLVEMVRRRIG